MCYLAWSMQQHFYFQHMSPPQKMSRLLQTFRSSEPYSRTSGDWGEKETESIDHFTVVCSVTWLLNGSEVGGDLVLIRASILLLCKSRHSHANKLALNEKSTEVCIKARLPSASLAFKGPVPKHRTANWHVDREAHGKTCNVEPTES